MQETWVPSLSWEHPLEKEMAIHSNILAWESPWIEEPGGYSPWGLKESDMTERLTLSLNVSSNLLRIPSFTPPYSFCSVSSKWLCCDEVPFSGSLRLWVSQIYLNVWPSFFPPRLKKGKMRKGRNLKVKRICRSFMEKKKKPLKKELYMLSELVKIGTHFNM